MRRDGKKNTANGKVGTIICLAHACCFLPEEESTEVPFYLNLKNPSHLARVTVLDTVSTLVSN